jgi:hypothetical protein
MKEPEIVHDCGGDDDDRTIFVFCSEIMRTKTIKNTEAASHQSGLEPCASRVRVIAQRTWFVSRNYGNSGSVSEVLARTNKNLVPMCFCVSPQVTFLFKPTRRCQGNPISCPRFALKLNMFSLLRLLLFILPSFSFLFVLTQSNYF